MPATYVCLYHGETIPAARVVAVSADPILARYVAQEMADDPFCDPCDPSALSRLAYAAHRAPRLIVSEAEEEGGYRRD